MRLHPVRKGYNRRRNFIEENIVKLREMEVKQRERSKDAGTSVTWLTQRSLKSRNRASSEVPGNFVFHARQRKRRRVNKCLSEEKAICTELQANVCDKSVGIMCMEEKILMGDYSSHTLHSNDDCLSSTSSAKTHHAKAQQTEKTMVDTHGNMENTANRNKLIDNAHFSRKPKAILKDTEFNCSTEANETQVSSTNVLVESSAHQACQVTNESCIKMTTKTEVAREKLIEANSSDPLNASSSYRKGVIPRYLKIQRNNRRYEEFQQFTCLTCQDEYIELSDVARRQVLELLRKGFADLTHELNKLHQSVSSLEIKNRCQNAEKEFKKIEEAIKVFSQPKVFVALGIKSIDKKIPE